ncbi:MAG: phospholipase D-like domain-containing protein [Actinomycetota bacterium]|nr:phospholipase D-like domain-containing protein [Actinomycetota bacterium]
MEPESPRRALECLLGIPSFHGNQVNVLRNGDQTFPAMLEVIGTATRTIDVQTYGYWSGSTGDEVARALAGRAQDGVRVRVLLDAFGTRRIDRRSIGIMEAAGAEVVWFRPLTNWRITQSTHRGHRKILICDGSIAFTGGFGFADEWRGDARDRSQWRDTALQLRGPVVNGLRGAFVNNWAETGRLLFAEDVDPFPLQKAAGQSAAQVVQGDAETGWGDMSTLVRGLLGLARRRLRISADYLVPDAGALELLCAAARRGVTVEVLRPAAQPQGGLSRLASRANYQRLLEAGVSVWEYQPTALNAKVMTVDGVVANVGPVDFDAGSLTLNDEVTVVVFDPSVVAELDGQFDADLGRSEPIGLDRWAGRGTGERVKEAAAGFFARRV